VRPLAAIRAAYGIVLLAVPGTLLQATGSDATTGRITVARILGARHLLQGLVQRRGAVPRLGAAVDALHAMSMFGLAALNDGVRAAAAVDGSVATTFAAAGMRFGRNGSSA
jgi:hypothetical protein